MTSQALLINFLFNPQTHIISLREIIFTIHIKKEIILLLASTQNFKKQLRKNTIAIWPIVKFRENTFSFQKKSAFKTAGIYL